MNPALVFLAALLAIECTALLVELHRADRRDADRWRVIRSQASVIRAQKAAIEEGQAEWHAARRLTAALERREFLAMPADYTADARTWPAQSEARCD